jgi:histidine triad (HIT) family protein
MITDCLFCQIAKKSEPAYIVFEDDKHLAFLDIHPQEAGHTLVIPKTHTAYYWEMTYEDWKAYMATVKRVTQILRESTKGNRVSLHILGIHVPHTHVHLIPSSFTDWAGTELPDIAREIRSHAA